MRLCEYVLENMSVGVQRRERDRLERFSGGMIEIRSLFIPMDRHICVLMPYNMPAVAWLSCEMHGAWLACPSNSLLGLDRQVVDTG